MTNDHRVTMLREELDAAHAALEHVRGALPEGALFSDDAAGLGSCIRGVLAGRARKLEETKAQLAEAERERETFRSMYGDIVNALDASGADAGTHPVGVVDGLIEERDTLRAELDRLRAREKNDVPELELAKEKLDEVVAARDRLYEAAEDHGKVMRLLRAELEEARADHKAKLRDVISGCGHDPDEYPHGPLQAVDELRAECDGAHSESAAALGLLERAHGHASVVDPNLYHEIRDVLRARTGRDEEPEDEECTHEVTHMGSCGGCDRTDIGGDADMTGVVIKDCKVDGVPVPDVPPTPAADTRLEPFEEALSVVEDLTTAALRLHDANANGKLRSLHDSSAFVEAVESYREFDENTPTPQQPGEECGTCYGAETVSLAEHPVTGQQDIAPCPACTGKGGSQ